MLLQLLETLVVIYFKYKRYSFVALLLLIIEVIGNAMCHVDFLSIYTILLVSLYY